MPRVMATNTEKKALDPIGTAALLTDISCMVAVPILLRFLTTHIDAWWVNALRFSTAVLFWLPFLLFRIRLI